MSTHPTILGDMVRNEAARDGKTSLDVERDLGIPGGADRGPDEPAGARPGPPDAGRQPGLRRQRTESE